MKTVVLELWRPGLANVLLGFWRSLENVSADNIPVGWCETLGHLPIDILGFFREWSISYFITFVSLVIVPATLSTTHPATLRLARTHQSTFSSMTWPESSVSTLHRPDFTGWWKWPPDEEPLFAGKNQVPSGKQPHNYGQSPFLMEKLTISMAIFNSYVSLPEGKTWVFCWKKILKVNPLRVFLDKKLTGDNKGGFQPKGSLWAGNKPTTHYKWQFSIIAMLNYQRVPSDFWELEDRILLPNLLILGNFRFNKGLTSCACS